MKKVLHTLKAMLVVSIALLMPLTKAKAQVSTVGDSLALVEIYNQTNGAGWYSKLNWLSGKVATWEGVTVTQGRVTKLELPANNLNGALPYHIGFLQELKSLNLSGNLLKGNVTPAIVFLQKLNVLNLSDNKFNGSIPTTIGFLFALTDLNLSKNTFSQTIPSSLLLLCNLKKLDLSNNLLTGSLPTQIGSLSKLEGLYVSNNGLQGYIPVSIGKLKKATNVYLDHNQFKGNLPQSIGDMDSLVFFNVSSNAFNGAVPATVTKLKKLYYFNVSDNAIVDLPNVSAVTSLFQFIVASNKLTFADIQPNLGRMLPGSYIPQDSVGTNLTITACEGDSVSISGNVIESNSNNRYIWFSTDGTFVSEETATPNLKLTNLTAADSRVYSVAISNSNVPDLYLFRRTVKLNVNSCTAGKSGATAIYPVPFTTETTVKVSTKTSESLKISVKDDKGMPVQLVDGKTNTEFKIGLTYKPGTYYVESNHGTAKEVLRIVKQ